MTPPPENVLTVERVQELRELLKRGTRIDVEIEALCDAWLAAQEPKGVDAWVSVTDRYPTELHVLVCDANTQWVGDYWRLHVAAPFPSDITHWQPMPAPPNTREGEAP